jgi:hypothetical protein
MSTKNLSRTGIQHEKRDSEERARWLRIPAWFRVEHEPEPAPFAQRT